MSIILVSKDNTGVCVSPKENGRWEWYVIVYTAEGVDYLRPSVVEDYPTQERAVTAMNAFLELHGLRAVESTAQPVFVNPELCDTSLN